MELKALTMINPHWNSWKNIPKSTVTVTFVLYTITLCTKFLQVLIFVIFCVFFFQVSAIKFNKKFLLKNLLHYQIYTYKHHKLNLVTAIHLNWLFHSETKKGIHNSIQEYNVKFCDRVTHRIVPSNRKKVFCRSWKLVPTKTRKILDMCCS